ncbi:MAG: S-methyl-5-thioribose-1-phosphate isomerase [Proteobacteria bacterium]|nr:S-methyl-5-thioribose-1-phosphate isomerase [Pseudomonadota bacterium]
MLNPISYKDNKIIILDQTKIPNDETYIEIDSIQRLYEAIKKLQIRGAPLLGIAAAYGIRLSSVLNINKNTDDYKKSLLKDIVLLKSSRPTAVNLFNVLDNTENIIKSHDDKFRIHESLVALAVHEEDKSMCDRIADNGVTLIKENAKILTHCNTGVLATGGIGTALGIIYRSFWEGKNPNVYVGETRPLLQGARLTAFELASEGINVHVLPDSARAYIMKDKNIDIVITGADRIAMNGDTANKIGTFDTAINAKYFNIPFYIAAPTSTFDKNASDMSDIPIEQRAPEELYKIGYQGLIKTKTDFINPAFDITPNELITGIITEKGIILPPYEKNIPDYI